MTKKSALEFDLMDLPGLHAWRGAWSRGAFASIGVRREAKALLFAELAESLRQNAPLDRALELIASESQREAKSSRNGFMILARNLLALVLLSFYFIYFFLSSQMTTAGRVARVLAAHLHDLVVKGMQLSDAMSRAGQDFDPEEIALVRLGEATGTLPQTLRRLVEFQAVEERYTHQRAKLMYPIIVFLIMSSICTFLVVMIIPKFTDIFMQLGAPELPPVTQTMIDFFDGVTGNALLMPLITLVLFFIVLRLLMNGNVMTRRVLAWGIFFLVASIGLRLMEAMISRSGLSYWLLVIVAFVLFIIFLIPYLFTTIEDNLNRLEHRLRRLLRFLPSFANPMRAEAEARWLSSLSISLQAGLPAPEALRLSGKIAGKKYRKPSERAATLVEKGNPLGEACLQAAVLAPATANQMALFAGDAGYLDRLSLLARDRAEVAQEQMIRYGWLAEVSGVIFCGVVAMLIALGMYMPLFTIPRIMAGMAD